MGSDFKAHDFSWLIRKTGVQEIDNQHTHLVALVMQTSMLSGKTNSREEIDEVLQAISTQVRDHFHYEETYMEKQGFLNISTHKEEHRILLQTIDEYLENVRLDRINFSKRSASKF